MSIKSSLKKNAFYSITISIPIVFFILIEISLRIFQYGNSYPLFIADKTDSNYMVINPEISRRYFRSAQVQVSTQLEFFLKNKPKNEFRIFVQGGSTTAGFPFNHGASFPRQLEKILQQTFPEKKIEVINTAITAVNSYTLLDFTEEIIEQNPDVVLIYAGHNEYYGAFGIGSTQSLGKSPKLINFYLKYRNVRIIQLFRSIIKSIVSVQINNNTTDETLMSRMVKEQEIPLNGKLYNNGLQQFSDNLDLILAQYKSNNIPVFIGTLASNVKGQHPFISGHLMNYDSVNWQQNYQKGLNYLTSENYDSALQSFIKAKAIDSSHAALNFNIGNCYLALEDQISASYHYHLAKELDLLRFRAPKSMNSIITKSALKNKAIVVDTEKDLQDASKNGIIGDEVMIEHLHPNLYGLSVISYSFYKTILAYQLIEDSTINTSSLKEIIKERCVTNIDSISGHLLITKLKNGWPFNEQSKESFIPSTIEEQLSYKKFIGEISWAEACNKLYDHYMNSKQYQKAIKISEALSQEFSNIVNPKIMLAEAHYYNQDYKKALVIYKQLLQSSPKKEILSASIKCLLKTKQEKNALQLAEKYINFADKNTMRALKEISAIVDDSLDIKILINKGGAYAFFQEYDKSKLHIERALRIDNNNQQALKLLEIVKQRSADEQF
ncbi:MAG: hypothetical protein OEW67_06625 [Cyclobacteriaceae bacterium]|nr:hypothetical protein [Cyclobacteriaceae bacterium]